MKKYFAKKIFLDDEKNRISKIINTIILVTCTGLLIVLLERILVQQYRLVPIIIVVELSLLISFFLLRKKKIYLSSFALLWTLLFFITYLAFTGEGLNDSALIGIPCFLIIGGVILKRRNFIYLVIASLICIILVGYFDVKHIIKRSYINLPGVSDIIDILIIFSITAITIGLVAENLLSSLSNARQNEAAIRISESRFKSLVTSMQDLVYTLDVELKVIGLYGQWSEMYGLTAELLLDKKFASFLSPGEAEINNAACERALSGEAVKYEWHLFQNEGDSFYFESSLTPFYDNQNKLIGIVGVARDITDRKKIEKILLKAKQEAEEASKLKSTLLANMSHELRTPLNGILGFSQIMFEVLKEESNREMILKIEKSARRLMDTLNSVLTLTELQNANYLLDESRIDLHLICDQLKILFKSKLEEKKLEFLVCVPEELPLFKTDEDLLKKALLYLVENAIKYTEKGKITVEVLASRTNNKISINVIDTGIGIKKEDLSKVFLEFKQISEGYTRQFEGLGLGLSITSQIVNLLGGKIFVESEFGKGSIFSLELPLIKNEAAGQSGNSTFDFDKTDKKNFQLKILQNILLVEDNPINAEVVSLFLTKIAKVDKAYNGEDAIRMANANDYQLLLLDINLGLGMDGIEVLKQIRKSKKYQNIQAIALTGYTSYKDKTDILAQGFNGYLAKPFDKKDLLSMINKEFPHNSDVLHQDIERRIQHFLL